MQAALPIGSLGGSSTGTMLPSIRRCTAGDLHAGAGMKLRVSELQESANTAAQDCSLITVFTLLCLLQFLHKICCQAAAAVLLTAPVLCLPDDNSCRCMTASLWLWSFRVGLAVLNVHHPIGQDLGQPAGCSHTGVPRPRASSTRVLLDLPGWLIRGWDDHFVEKPHT